MNLVVIFLRVNVIMKNIYLFFIYESIILEDKRFIEYIKF